MKSFSGKITLITGGAGGVGRLLARKMAMRGTHAVLWDINDEALAQAADEIRAAGGKVSSYTCNVANTEMVYATAAKVRREVGKVDILVNNAGVVNGKPFLECSDEELRRTMEVNILSHFWTVKAFLPDMIKADSGHLVTIASAGGIVGSAGLVDYSASKFAAFGFDEALRAELKQWRLNIRTTVVCPFFINTGMFAGVQSRFPFLLPILNDDEVAERIVRAVARGKERVILPPFVYTTWPLRLVPVKIFDWVVTLLGVNNAMDTFRGEHSPNAERGTR
jgi:all-trans-retinol dehydrogenase (NAD+)